MSAFVARRTAEEVCRAFKLPTCHKVFPRDIGKGRPCLNYHIGQCMGVCRGKIDEASYADIIAEAVEYIKNGSAQSVERMTRQMEDYAERLEFEKAAKLRDRINAIKHAADAQTVIDGSLPDTDAVAIARNGIETCAAVIMYRGGRLADRAEFFLGEELDISAEGASSLTEEFVTQYYSGFREIPRQVVLYNETTDRDSLERLLRERSGRAVDVLIPQKGRYMRLAETARDNAAEYLSIRVGRTSKEIAALEELAELLGLDKTPMYIESYDISNLGSEDMVAGMIVFENGRPAKKLYKRFSIKENVIQNDLACMQEVLRRRFTHYLDPEETDEGFRRMPDLILLDGGEGQLNAVRQVMAELGIHTNVFGMVKDGNHRTRAITSDGGEIGISSRQAAFLLVTRIQDEVHRFAITYQRKRHRASTLTSGLTSIRGIGDKKAAALMGEFKTVDRLKAATPEEIAAAIKVSVDTASQVCEYVREML